jgi:glutathione transport system substrate-binding protein
VGGGELIFALSSDPPNLDPHISTGTAARTVKLQLYNGLLRYFEDGSFGPDLAETWEVSDDGLQYTFTLKQGLQFHDGSLLTAQDVEATNQRIQNESVGATQRVELTNITAVTVADDQTVRFTLLKPHAALLAYLTLPECAVLSSAFLARGGDPNTEVVGTGPFTFVSREPGVRIEVARNENYHQQGLPYLDRIVFIPYPDENTRMSAVRGGDAQIADYVPWKDMSSVEQDPDLKLENGAELGVHVRDLQRPPEAVRQPAGSRGLELCL